MIFTFDSVFLSLHCMEHSDSESDFTLQEVVVWCFQCKEEDETELILEMTFAVLPKVYPRFVHVLSAWETQGGTNFGRGGGVNFQKPWPNVPLPNCRSLKGVLPAQSATQHHGRRSNHRHYSVFHRRRRTLRARPQTAENYCTTQTLPGLCR